MKRKTDIGDLIKAKFENAERSPDDQLWEKINTSLDRRERNRKLLIYFLLSIVLIGSGLFFVLVNQDSHKENPATQNTELSTPVQNEVQRNLQNSESIASEEGVNSSENDFDVNSEEKDNQNKESSINETIVSRTEKSGKYISGRTGTKNEKSVVNENRTQGVLDKDNSKSQNDEVTENSKEYSNSTFSDIVKETDSLSEDIVEDVLEEEVADITDENKPKKKSKPQVKKKSRYWGVGVVGAGEYFGSFSFGSMIDTRLDRNKTKGDKQFQYGISAHVLISDRLLDISYGVSHTKYSYTTLLNPSDNALSLSAVNYKSLTEAAQFIAQASSVDIFQEISYYELPLQFTHKIVVGKLGLEAMAGFSTYLLNENKVYLIDDSGERLMIGKANNLSKISFSINTGFGPYYQFTDQLKLNIMPVFKYNFQTLSKNSYGRQNNYALGIYGRLTYYFDFGD